MITTKEGHITLLAEYTAFDYILYPQVLVLDVDEEISIFWELPYTVDIVTGIPNVIPLAGSIVTMRMGVRLVAYDILYENRPMDLMRCRFPNEKELKIYEKESSI